MPHIHPEKTITEKDTCTPVFIAAVFTIARTWKQPRCPWTDEWIKKLWYIYTMEYYSAIKRNIFESVLMRWMKLELVIQSKVSQKEKNKCHVLMHIYESTKMALMNLFAGQQWRLGHREQTSGHRGQRRGKSSMEKYTLPYVKQIACGNLLYDSGSSNPMRSGMGWEVGGSFNREGMCVYPWLTHADVRQKPAHYCKAIILQLKINK